VYCSSDSRQGVSTRVDARHSKDRVSRSEKLADNGFADKSCGSRYEYTHTDFLMGLGMDEPILLRTCQQ
jgi:hypothetical protein